MILKVYIIKSLVRFEPKMFYKEVLMKITPTTIVAFIIPSLCYITMSEGLFRTTTIVVLSEVSVVLSILMLGLTGSERNKILSVVKNRICRMK